MQPQPVLGFLQHSANVVRGSFNVTFLQGGVYTCRAQNSEGRSSTEEELEITCEYNASSSPSSPSSPSSSFYYYYDEIVKHV
jgi:hypothetical protein